MEKVTKKTVGELFDEILVYLKDTKANNELIEFVESRAKIEAKARARAKQKRLEKGGEKKDIAQSEYYTNLRNALKAALTADFQTGKALAEAAGVKALPAQVSTALRPMVDAKEVVSEKIKVEVVGKDGLKREALQVAFKLA